jgi:hypothetical protein
VGGVALDRAQVVEDLVQLGVLPARRVDPGIRRAAVVVVLLAGSGVAVDLAEAADPDRGIHPDQVLAVGAVEALGDQLGPHQAEAVVTGGGEGHPGHVQLAVLVGDEAQPLAAAGLAGSGPHRLVGLGHPLAQRGDHALVAVGHVQAWA